MWIPQENEAGYGAGNAMNYAKNLKGRLLIYYGTADNNVHPNNSMQLIRALQQAGKSFEVQVGPDAGHSGVNNPRMMEFFIENLVHAAGAADGAGRREVSAIHPVHLRSATRASIAHGDVGPRRGRWTRSGQIFGAGGCLSMSRLARSLEAAYHRPADGFRVSTTTAPSFMTHRTPVKSTSIFSSGLPSTATMSAR